MSRSFAARWALAAFLGFAPGAAAQTNFRTDLYWVIVVSDGPPGSSRPADGYEMAVYRSYDETEASRFESLSSLCVSHTLVGQYGHARHHCAEALAATEQSTLPAVSDENGGVTALALAYSNRGVLRVCTGSLEDAAEDFRTAIALNPRSQVPARNLARLNGAWPPS